MRKTALYSMLLTGFVLFGCSANNQPVNPTTNSNPNTNINTTNQAKIDEQQAKVKLMSTKKGQEMDASKRATELMPFTLTTILREQMLNLVEENEGVNIILKRVTKSVPKDRFSAFIYGLYYIKLEEDRSRKKKKRGISGLMLFSSGR